MKTFHTSITVLKSLKMTYIDQTIVET